MMHVEEKQRIPIAQGLPWTTDEPECLIKPLVKENTRPIDLKLHSDVLAVECTKFDHQRTSELGQGFEFVPDYCRISIILLEKKLLLL
ncbi:hypothetical protein LWI28_014198 [Acer negundo]|uniref:Uncharacterized protein n=1 Tax=Acer negundo TaxID=4023 RepID=A0AAD5NWT1_ACENE|nr:hypothetical protein LWI28_014198 [Acer negundo]